MADGFEIHDKFYPVPEAFRLGDPVLVEEITGLTWGEFADRMDEPEGDPTVMLGMVAVAVWQANPRWRRDRVARWVEALGMEDVKFIGEEKDEAAVPLPEKPSARDDDSSSRSRPPVGSGSDTTLLSTTPDGSPPTIPVSA